MQQNVHCSGLPISISSKSLVDVHDMYVLGCRNRCMTCTQWVKKIPVWSFNTEMPLGIVLSQNAGKYLLSSPMWGVTLAFMLEADFPFTARSWPHHKSPETREKSPAQFQFHLTHLTPLPGITGLAPLTAFSWPAVWFVCLTFPLEFSLHLSGIQRLFFLCFSWLCPHTLFLALCWIVGRLYGENCGIRRGSVS